MTYLYLPSIPKYFVTKTTYCVTMTLFVTQKTVGKVLFVTLFSRERPESFNPDMFAAFHCIKIKITYKECHNLIQFIISSINSHKRPVQLLFPEVLGCPFLHVTVGLRRDGDELSPIHFQKWLAEFNCN